MGEVLAQCPSSKASNAKPVKLRESCDCCLVAKVKCGKERPLCKRCLTNGSSCIYSPSSKTGRRSHKNVAIKADSVAQQQSSISTQTSPRPVKDPYERAQSHLHRDKDVDMLDGTSTLFDDKNLPPLAMPQNIHDPLNEMAADGVIGDTKANFDVNLSASPFCPSEFLDPSISMFEPENRLNFSAAPFKASPAAGDATFNGSYSELGLQLPSPTPAELSRLAHLGSSDHMTRPSHTLSPSDLCYNEANSCDCFAACLQILQSLHSHSCRLAPAQPNRGLSFDVVLNTNKDAIGSCASLLTCLKCVSECGKGVVNMLLATVLGKVISLYRAICVLMFGSSNNMQDTAQLAFGVYKVTGMNRRLLEIEILLLDLRRVAGVLMSYTDRSSNGPLSNNDDKHVYETLKTYLEHNLRNLVQYLNAQKSSVSKS